MTLFNIAIITVCLLVVVWVLTFRQYKTFHILFKYYRSKKRSRFCKICNQQQYLFEDEHNYFKWEDIGVVKEPNCECHQYST